MLKQIWSLLFTVGVSVGALGLMSAPAAADIPAAYKGTPYLGKPSVIPGRVDFANLDVGGSGVSYHADHNRTNSAGYEPISGNDYRPTENDLPNICKTNVNQPPDTWVDGSPYPSTTERSWYYIGYAHKDWVRVTVDVKQAGTYKVSSNWATSDAKLAFSIWFNDGTTTGDGVNKSGVITLDGTSDYHKWKAYPDFARVTLGAGLQVMTFHLELDHLQYGFLQFDLVGDPAADGGAPASDASAPTPDAAVDASAGTGDSVGGGGTTGGQAGATEPMGTGGSMSTPGAAGETGTGGGAAGVMGAAGSTSGGVPVGGGAAGSGGGATKSSGCAIVTASHTSPSWPTAEILVGIALLARRRRSSRL